MAITFSINQYDHDGYKYDDCILLHLEGGNTILRFKNVVAMVAFANEIQGMVPEIVENIGERQ